jgi:ATP-dependent protease ClpP protease subunit
MKRIINGFLVFSICLLAYSMYVTYEYELAKPKEVAAEEPLQGPASKVQNIERLVLSEGNSVFLQGEINDRTGFYVQKELLDKSMKLPAAEPIYLILHTPGGWFETGYDIINLARGLNREVKTVTLDAASMGFIIVQNLGERLIVPRGQLMTHQATISPAGIPPGKMHSDFLPWLNEFLYRFRVIEQATASRLGLTYEDYIDLIKIDYYYRGGFDAVRRNAADRIVIPECSKHWMKNSPETCPFGNA